MTSSLQHCTTTLVQPERYWKFYLGIVKEKKSQFPTKLPIHFQFFGTAWSVFYAGTGSHRTCLFLVFGEMRQLAWNLMSIFSPIFFCFHYFRIVKARIQQKIECYEVEWQNVQLGETCPTFFVTIETREVIKIMIIMTN